jgi:hypothetical protein
MKCQFKGRVAIMRTVIFKNVVTFQQESLNGWGGANAWVLGSTFIFLMWDLRFWLWRLLCSGICCRVPFVDKWRRFGECYNLLPFFLVSLRHESSSFVSRTSDFCTLRLVFLPQTLKCSRLLRNVATCLPDTGRDIWASPCNLTSPQDRQK